MQLFKIEKNIVTVNPAALLIQEFKVVWEADKSKDKSTALKEMAYIYFKADYKSSYLSYLAEDRERAIIDDVFGKDVQWTPGPLVLSAILKYEKFQENHYIKLLKSQRTALEKMMSYYNSVDFELKDNKGNHLYKITEVSKAMGDTAKIIDSLNKLDEIIRKELRDTKRNRGGEESGAFEDHDL
tara:strand:+ start:49352 stop:49903 length:552 start_codon:yes stop_codon:yes gene_type:complete